MTSVEMRPPVLKRANPTRETNCHHAIDLGGVPLSKGRLNAMACLPDKNLSLWNVRDPSSAQKRKWTLGLSPTLETAGCHESMVHGVETLFHPI